MDLPMGYVPKGEHSPIAHKLVCKLQSLSMGSTKPHDNGIPSSPKLLFILALFDPRHITLS